MTEIILIFVMALCVFGLYGELTSAGHWDSKEINRELRKNQKKQKEKGE